MKFLINYIITHRGQITRFVLIGLTTFAIYVTCFHFLYGLIHFGYRCAASIAYLITIGTHFILNRVFTFQAQEQFVASNLWKYIFMLGLNYINMLTIMWFVVAITKNSPYVGAVVSTGTTAAMNFFFMKYYVFREKISKLNFMDVSAGS